MLTTAVIGLGYWGPNLVRNLAASPRTRAAWICDRSPGRLDAVGAHFPAAARAEDPAAVLADPEVDAVVIATPVATHHALARAALLAGKHVLVEKPLAATAEQAEELRELAERRGLVLLVDHVFLYSPAVRKLAQLVAAGDLGEPLFIDSVRINLGLVQHDVDVVWDLAPHDLAIIDHLVGRVPDSVVAIGASHSGGGPVDGAHLHLDYGGGLHAAIHVSWLSPVKIRSFLLGGTRRSVLYNDLDAAERLKVYDRGIEVTEALSPEGRRELLVSYRSGDVVAPRLDSAEPLALLVEHFADCIEKDVPPLSGGDQGLRVVRVLEAAQRSLAAAGERVAV